MGFAGTPQTAHNSTAEIIELHSFHKICLCKLIVCFVPLYPSFIDLGLTVYTPAQKCAHTHSHAHISYTHTWRNTLQYTATHCTTLQHTTTHCDGLQRTATHCT